MSDSVRILVVDDSGTQRFLLQSVLRPAGFEIVTAVDGVEAFELVQRDPPDLVVTDLQMPRMDGLQLVREIGQLQLSIPVILTTAAGSELIAAEALHAGAASYVPKSGLSTLLLPTVRRILELKKATQENKALSACLDEVTYQWRLTNDPSLVPDLIGRVESILSELIPFDQSQHMQIAMSLDEAIVNAIVHGNLEINSEIRQLDDGQVYFETIDKRRKTPPYCDRRVLFRIEANRQRVTFTIRDEGPGFCVDGVADATDPANLEKAGGRGLLLMNAFMDELQYNDCGNQLVMTKRLGSVVEEAIS
ncbi:Chemotaxis protein CheY [Novipirellula aureliae]|uniref:Chemotaxis protein CheY n=1 Tax=Novipirellula aureliae TaxID=2527966 RepID=A0A5C6EA63_9BACT|nr:response regulator [Novipirellula aureliae]TWU45384.1 Chemotaxis protein CheY [Novipirellula aureliae]